MYPLGNSFTMPVPEKKVLIVGGGSGIAPFVMLGRNLKKNGNKVTFLIGGKSKKDVLISALFSEFGEVFTTTEDGSAGERGFVTDHSLIKTGSPPFDKIYSCGPEAMMKAVGKIAKQNNIDCEVSLENMMACGFGACLCCVTETIDGNKRVCKEGPVFNINYLKWRI
jgi:dihydroorotate dehydrogenase electron transfer subunit